MSAPDVLPLCPMCDSRAYSAGGHHMGYRIFCPKGCLTTTIHDEDNPREATREEWCKLVAEWKAQEDQP